MTKLSLTHHGITVADVRHNLSPARLYEDAIRYDHRASIASYG